MICIWANGGGTLIQQVIVCGMQLAPGTVAHGSTTAPGVPVAWAVAWAVMVTVWR